jgi:hypothetical protein
VGGFRSGIRASGDRGRTGVLRVGALSDAACLDRLPSRSAPGSDPLPGHGRGLAIAVLISDVLARMALRLDRQVPAARYRLDPAVGHRTDSLQGCERVRFDRARGI